MPRMLEARLPLPKFASEEEEAQYWETHSAANIWNKLPPAKPLKRLDKLSAGRKELVAVPLESAQLEKAKQIAARKSIGYQTQLRRWIADGIRREAKG